MDFRDGQIQGDVGHPLRSPDLRFQRHSLLATARIRRAGSRLGVPQRIGRQAQLCLTFERYFFLPFFKFGPAKTTTFYVGIELREAFEAEAQESKRPRLLLTAAVPVGPDNINGGYDVPAVSSYLDFINVMAYDFHGKWENTVGHNAPLFAPSSDSEWRKQLSVDHASNLWVRLGAPREKLIIGMGTYGRSFTLTDTNRFIVNEPASGGGTAGVYTRESGFLAYYEVKIVGESGATSWRVSSLFFL